MAIFEPTAKDRLVAPRRGTPIEIPDPRELPAPTTRTVDLDRFGNSGGEPLLFIHGFTGSKEDFSGWLPDFARLGFDAVSFDLAGHGFSAPLGAPSEYGLDAYASDALAVIDCLGWETAHIVGHSMGGMVAQIMAISRPNRIRSLVLMGTHHGAVEIDPELTAFGAEYALTNGMIDLNALMKTLTLPTTTTVGADLRNDPAYDDFMNQKFERSDPAMFAGMLHSMTQSPDRLEALSAFSGRTLIVVGENDATFGPACRSIAERLPNGALAVIAGAGHNPQFEAPEMWFELIADFLTERDSNG